MMSKSRKRKGRLSSRKGFTLVEVIMTVAILSFGIVTIYEALFVSVDAYGYYTHYLNVQNWLNEKLWETQEELTAAHVLEDGQRKGQIVREHKTYDWIVDISQIDEMQGLYRINITLSWYEGNRVINTSRESYLLPPELKKYNEEGSV